MGKVKNQREVFREVVRGREFRIELTTWWDSSGLSYDVYDVKTGQCLTVESYDDKPTPNDIEDLLYRLSEDLKEGTLDPFFEGVEPALAEIVTEECG